MKVFTGSKTRRIKSNVATTDSPFEFNQSITPHGGTTARLKINKDDDGYHQIRIFQDTNKDGKASRKELIYAGRIREPVDSDELLNFAGSIKLSKTMHRCDWQLQKNPEDVAGCTMEYIPTTFACQLISNEGDRYRLDGIGEFQENGFLVTGDPAISSNTQPV